jgi:hypothetical protein
VTDSARLDRILRRQHGTLTTADATDCGISRHGLAHRVDRRRLLRVHRGVYLDPSYQHHELARSSCALRLAGHGAAVSHLTAARLLRLELPSRLDGDGRIHISLPPGRRRGRGARDVRVHHLSAPLTSADLVTVRGLRATTVERTALDLCPLLARMDREALIARLVQSGRTDLDRLVRAVERAGAARGAALLGRICRTFAPGFESAFEADTGNWLTRRGLHVIAQPWVRLPTRRVRLDLLVEGLLDVETDGSAFHLSPQARDADLLRDEQLRELGLEVVRVSFRQRYDAPAQTLARIRRAVARQRGRFPAGLPAGVLG